MSIPRPSHKAKGKGEVYLNNTTYYCCEKHLEASVKCLRKNYDKIIIKIEKHPTHIQGSYDCEFEECHNSADLRLIVMDKEKVKFT